MIRIEHLTYIVSDGRVILDDITLAVPEGRTMAVMGMSGTGKTSLLKCIGGLVRPASGQIWIGDHQIVGLNEREMNTVRQRLGYVFQYAALFDSMTVYDNVAFGPRQQGMRPGAEMDRLVEEKLALVGMDGTQAMLPAQLSGGMQKRVGLARALALNPDVLLYDEPTSGLDPITAAVIDELVNHMRDTLGVTSIVVSHNIESIHRVADLVTMLYEGKVIATGTLEEVRACEDARVRQFLEGRSQGPIIVA